VRKFLDVPPSEEKATKEDDIYATKMAIHLVKRDG
jgi:hypothetical protein